MFVIEIVAQFSLKNHLTYAAYTAFFAVAVVGTCHLPIFVPLTLALTLYVRVRVPVCLRP